MGSHRNPKSEEDLILEDKLDLARTLVRLKSRQWVRRELNDLEPGLVEGHAKEMSAGEVTRLEIEPGRILGTEETSDD